MNHCGGCPRVWGGANMSHCGVCHLTFSTVGNFDRHRVGTVDRRTCAEPAAVGLQEDARGVFRQPGVSEGTQGPISQP